MYYDMLVRISPFGYVYSWLTPDCGSVPLGFNDLWNVYYVTHLHILIILGG